jgi:hypothetical protein
MDYFRPASAGSHGDDRLRLAGTKGIAEYMAATGVTVVSTGAKPRKVEQLPEGGSVFIDYLEAVYNGKPETLTLTDIYRVTEITLRAHEAAERHAIVKI